MENENKELLNSSYNIAIGMLIDCYIAKYYLKKSGIYAGVVDSRILEIKSAYKISDEIMSLIDNLVKKVADNLK